MFSVLYTLIFILVSSKKIFDTVTDQNGNFDNNTATVTVEDMIDPVDIGQDITVDLDGNPFVSITVNDVDNGSSDNCGFSLSIDVDTYKTEGVYPVKHSYRRFLKYAQCNCNGYC